MTDLNARCLATDSGRPCDDIVTSNVPVALCQRHRMQVAISIVPEMLLAAAKADYRAPRQMDVRAQDVIDNAGRAPIRLSASHPSCVYFLSRGDRIKIGVTANLGQRLTAFHADAADVLLLLEGTRRLEMALHEHFADFRVAGTEWFARVPALEDFIQSKRQLPSMAVPPESPTPPYASGCRPVHVDADELLEMAARAIKPGDTGVHLADIVMAFREAGVAADWSLAGLGRAYERTGMRVRAGLRIGRKISIGIHREDLQEAGLISDPADRHRTRSLKKAL